MTCSGGSDPGQGYPEPCHSKPDVSWLLLRYEISGFHTQRYKVILNTFQYYRGGFAPLAPPGDLPRTLPGTLHQTPYSIVCTPMGLFYVPRSSYRPRADPILLRLEPPPDHGAEQRRTQSGTA